MPRRKGTAWELVLDSGFPEKIERLVVPAGEPYEVISRSTALLRELAD